MSTLQQISYSGFAPETQALGNPYESAGVRSDSAVIADRQADIDDSASAMRKSDLQLGKHAGRGKFASMLGLNVFNAVYLPNGGFQSDLTKNGLLEALKTKNGDGGSFLKALSAALNDTHFQPGCSKDVKRDVRSVQEGRLHLSQLALLLEADKQPIPENSMLFSVLSWLKAQPREDRNKFYLAYQQHVHGSKMASQNEFISAKL